MRYNSQICTNEKQSKRLLDMGLNPETADMFHVWDYTTNCINGVNVLYNLNQLESNDIPAWSLSRLIEFLPTNIVKKGYTFNSNYKNVPSSQFYLSIWPFYRKQISYEVYVDGEPYYLWKSTKNNLFDNIIDCIEWIITEKPMLN